MQNLKYGVICEYLILLVTILAKLFWTFFVGDNPS